MSEGERRECLKWARSSDQAKEVKRMETEFLKKINAVTEVAMEAKKETKASKQKKTIKNLELCKAHRGPLTANDIQRLNDLTYEQIMLEVGYLKKNVAPNIRFKRKDGKKFVKFSIEEIKQQIRDVIEPNSSAVQSDVDTLLRNIYSKDIDDDEAPTEDVSMMEQDYKLKIGTVGLWRGQVGETKVCHG